jgi:hypothetical protein
MALLNPSGHSIFEDRFLGFVHWRPQRRGEPDDAMVGYKYEVIFRIQSHSVRSASRSVVAWRWMARLQTLAVFGM